MTNKQVYRFVIAIETTFSQGHTWPASRDCLDKFVRTLDACAQRSMYGLEGLQIALVLFGTDDPSSPFSVQSSGWTSDVREFRQWADGIRFEGGGAKQVGMIHCNMCKLCGLLQPPM